MISKQVDSSIGIEDVLLNSEIITHEQFEEVKNKILVEQVDSSKILLKFDNVYPIHIAAAYSALTGIPYVSINDYSISEDIVQLIPEKISRRHKLIALKRLDDTRLLIGLTNPYDITGLDDLSIILGFYTEIVIVPENELIISLDKYYVSSDSIEHIVEDLTENDVELITDTSGLSIDSNDEDDETPVIKYVNMIIMKALKDRASDIHLESFEKNFRIRERIDGVLIKMPSPPRNLQSGIISRIKVMANMNIAETRLPQDGRIKLKLSQKNIDIRVATCPTMWGESVVLRLLDKNAVMYSLNELGLSDTIRIKFEKILKNPNGVILVTGPTGSGKTTTLYAGIHNINSPDVKIITVEDPVEYEVKGLMQCQVDEKAGTTFASALRSILRQDPDIILIGEIRDDETAAISIESALTGHLVLSSTHTNEAAGAITRLIDMGIEPFLIVSTVRGILAQRLVRLICSYCKNEYTPSADLFYKLGKKPEDYNNIKFFKGIGCEHCAKTGYRGRIGIYELFELNDEIIKHILNKSPANLLNKLAIKNGMTPMREDAFKKVCAGFTTLEEIVRVAPIETGVSIAAQMHH